MLTRDFDYITNEPMYDNFNAVEFVKWCRYRGCYERCVPLGDLILADYNRLNQTVATYKAEPVYEYEDAIAKPYWLQGLEQACDTCKAKLVNVFNNLYNDEIERYKAVYACVNKCDVNDVPAMDVSLPITDINETTVAEFDALMKSNYDMYNNCEPYVKRLLSDFNGFDIYASLTKINGMFDTEHEGIPKWSKLYSDDLVEQKAKLEKYDASLEFNELDDFTKVMLDDYRRYCDCKHNNINYLDYMRDNTFHDYFSYNSLIISDIKAVVRFMDKYDTDIFKQEFYKTAVKSIDADVTGVWCHDGLYDNVHFNKTWGTHTFSYDDCCKLLIGESIDVANYVTKAGTPLPSTFGLGYCKPSYGKCRSYIGIKRSDMNAAYAKQRDDFELNCASDDVQFD